MREVEAKLQFVRLSSEQLVARLRSAGLAVDGPSSQVDYVYASTAAAVRRPSRGRPIARVRVESRNASSMTVKRRRIADLDRDEVEMDVPDPEAARTILAALGLQLVVVVRKRRWSLELDGGVSATVDDVDGLGVFVEVELLLPDDDARDRAGVLAESLARIQETLRATGTPVRYGYDRLLLQEAAHSGPRVWPADG